MKTASAPDLQPSLHGELLHLRPLRSDDFDALFAVAADPLIWEQHPARDRYQPDVFRAFFDEAMASGGALIATDAKGDRVIGGSRYHGYNAEESEIEIGWTFLARAYWGGKYNREMKELMLRHAFTFVDRVVFLIGPENYRSQRAVEKIGASPAGTRIDVYGRERLAFVIAKRSLSLLLFALISLAQPAFSQDVDSSRSKTVVTGLVTVTNKGISTVPSFTLGKPAAILNVSIARSGFAFEPELKYGLDGKPWAFLFWGRYRLDRDRFHLTIGEHPSVNFRTRTVSIDQSEREVIEARRFLAGELYPSYSVSANVGVGVYYLYSRGFDPDVAENNHFLALRTTLSNVPRSDSYFVRFIPQVFYLKQDARDGFYINSALAIGKGDLPLSVGAQVNRTIQTSILEGDDFIWNVSLSYAFR
jgi:N-acetyltransferase